MMSMICRSRRLRSLSKCFAIPLPLLPRIVPPREAFPAAAAHQAVPGRKAAGEPPGVDVKILTHFALVVKPGRASSWQERFKQAGPRDGRPAPMLPSYLRDKTDSRGGAPERHTLFPI